MMSFLSACLTLGTLGLGLGVSFFPLHEENTAVAVRASRVKRKVFVIIRLLVYKYFVGRS